MFNGENVLGVCSMDARAPQGVPGMRADCFGLRSSAVQAKSIILEDILMRLAGHLAIALVATILCAPAALPQEYAEGVIDSDQIVHEQGHCYTVGVDTPVRADGYYGNVSRLRLYEDDTALGPAHSMHEAIRNMGEGRFSHWGSRTGEPEVLYFSASDNSDPRTNGRTYRWRVRLDAGVPEGAQLANGVPAESFTRDANTVLLAHLDGEDEAEADYARGEAAEVGGGHQSVQGRFGAGVRLGERGLVYHGIDNLFQERGTVEFWLRATEPGELWAPEGERSIFAAVGGSSRYAGRFRHGLALTLDGGQGTLTLTASTDAPVLEVPEATLTVPAPPEPQDGWHHILAGWDNRPPRRLWLLLDGTGGTVELDEQADPRGLFAPVTALRFGTAGADIDEVRVLDVPPEGRMAGAEAEMPQIDMAELTRMQDIARRWLDLLIEVQQWGVLPTEVAWPALEPTEAPLTLRNSDHEMHMSRPFIQACRIWGDERYLRAAGAMAEAYHRAALPNGGWTQQYSLDIDGSLHPRSSIAHFEEWTTSTPIRTMAAMHAITGLDSFLEWAVEGAQVILTSQDESGWWPWGAAGIPGSTVPEYLSGPTLNDWNANCCMEDCLVLYHLTGDERYREAIFALGDWLISAQLGPPTYGWAAQYDREGQPAWGRAFEPPAADMLFGTFGAGRALLMLYDITGEDRYLEPLRRHLAFLESIPEDQKGWLWYAHRDWSAEENRGQTGGSSFSLAERYGAEPPSEETLAGGIAIHAGEPIVGYYHQMCPITYPELDSYLTPLDAHYGSKSRRAESWLREELAKRADGPIAPLTQGPVPREQFADARITPERAAELFDPSSVDTAVEQLAALFAGQPAADGVLVVGPSGRTVNVSRGCRHTERILQQIGLAYIALGKLPVQQHQAYAGGWGWVDPSRDWYDLGADGRPAED